MLKRHPLWFGSLILICLSLLMVVLIRLVDNGVLGWGGKQIGVIELNGVILNPLPLVEQIRRMEQLRHVAGVVVRIESPGGSVAAAQEVHEALLQLRDKKPVHVSLGSVGASGGYYIACAADRIVANPGTLTGSIGVLLEWANLEELGNRAGVKMFSIKSGKYKNVPSMFEELHESERNLLGKVVGDTYEQFVRAVLEGRPQLKEARVRELADGRVLTGRQAFEAGLVDGLGGYASVVENLASQLEIPQFEDVLKLEGEDSSLATLLGLGSLERWLPIQVGGIRLNYLLQ